MKTLLIFPALICCLNSFTQSPGIVDEAFECGWLASEAVKTISIQPDGKVLVGGLFHTFNDEMANGIVRLNASDLSIDETFNAGDGVNDNALNTQVLATAVQTDGKIIVAGYFTSYDGVSRTSIVRVNADGSPDPTFNPGSGATYIIAGDAYPAFIFDVAIQPDGKIIIVGSFTKYNGINAKSIARLNTDGSMDATFSVGSGANSIIYAIEMQTDGKILIGGSFTSYKGTTLNRIGRLKSNGNVDASFTTGSGASSNVNEIVLQADNKILVVGDFITFNGSSYRKIVRLNTNGTIDASFNPGTGAAGISEIKAVAIHPDNRIMIGGSFTSYNGTACSNFLMLQSNGSVDPAFTHATSFTEGFGISDIKIQPDGKILLASGQNININDVYYNRFIRIEDDGNVDEDMLLKKPGFDFECNDLSMLPDGSTIAAGMFTSYQRNEGTYVLKFDESGNFDPAFNFTPGESRIWRNFPQEDGSIYVTDDDALFYRINSDGNFDNTFAVFDQTYVRSIIYLPDGKMIVGGNNINYLNTNLIYRLNEDGTPDPTIDYPDFHITDDFFDELYKMAPSLNGNILIAGDFTEYGGVPVQNIFQIDAEGNIDPTFDIGSGPDLDLRISNFYVLNDGKIIAGGNFDSWDGHATQCIVRLNPDGSVDPTFSVPAEAILDYRIEKLLFVLPGGKILCQANNGLITNTLVRLNEDGTPDESFIATPRIYGDMDDLVLTSDGHYIVCGDFQNFGPSTKDNIVWIKAEPLICAYPDGMRSDHITVSSAKIYWDLVPGALKYQVRYRPVGALIWQKKNSLVLNKTLTGLMPSTTYEYSVRIECSPGSFSAFSPNKTFTTDDARQSAISQNLNISIYPNPADDFVVIQGESLADGAVIELVDMNGQTVETINVDSDQIYLNLTSLPDGIYVIHIISGETEITKKIVKQ